MIGTTLTPDVQVAAWCRGAGISSMLLAALLAFLTGCGTIASGLPPAPAVPAVVAEPTDLPPYRIQIGDVLGIKLLQANELSEDVTVRPDGHISTGVVEDMQAAGVTVPQLTENLKEAYSKIMKPPYMTIIVRSYAPSRIYVGGEVNDPGEFIEDPPNLTLSQAIARAGGTKFSGSESNIFVIRRGPHDEPQLFITRYDRLKHAADASADIRLANYDVVYVPRTTIAEVYMYFNQYLQQFVPLSWGFTYSGTLPTLR
jgi:polysaccharide export outer membrane protein